jgi:hypothetical protein
MGNYDISRRARMAWQNTLGEMLAYGTHVRWTCCSPCQFWQDVDVAALVADRGPAGSLWNEHPPCPVCGGRTLYMASAGPGTVFRPLIDGR